MSASPRRPVLCCEHLDVNTELICSARSQAVSVRCRRRTVTPQRILELIVLVLSDLRCRCFSYFEIKNCIKTACSIQLRLKKIWKTEIKGSIDHRRNNTYSSIQICVLLYCSVFSFPWFKGVHNSKITIYKILTKLMCSASSICCLHP